MELMINKILDHLALSRLLRAYKKIFPANLILMIYCVKYLTGILFIRYSSLICIARIWQAGSTLTIIILIIREVLKPL